MFLKPYFIVTGVLALTWLFLVILFRRMFSRFWSKTSRPTALEVTDWWQTLWSQTRLLYSSLPTLLFSVIWCFSIDSPLYSVWRQIGHVCLCLLAIFFSPNPKMLESTPNVFLLCQYSLSSGLSGEYPLGIRLCRLMLNYLCFRAKDLSLEPKTHLSLGLNLL